MQIHGNGTMMSFVNGAKLEGKWVHGHRIGNAKLTFKPTGEVWSLTINRAKRRSLPSLSSPGIERTQRRVQGADAGTEEDEIHLSPHSPSPQ